MCIRDSLPALATPSYTIFCLPAAINPGSKSIILPRVFGDSYEVFLPSRSQSLLLQVVLVEGWFMHIVFQPYDNTTTANNRHIYLTLL
eukprot:TRINITY_DN9921_c0_g1_i2.p1 TRINITY_DN9921_c0_g1~~TRINITY_DN9921_c0_g1_i2.p1  ORF type:complete len:103 (-),score=6.07 TRINITY_DN9921_c0_g1_i2:370-633(-)